MAGTAMALPMGPSLGAPGALLPKPRSGCWSPPLPAKGWKDYNRAADWPPASSSGSAGEREVIRLQCAIPSDACSVALRDALSRVLSSMRPLGAGPATPRVPRLAIIPGQRVARPRVSQRLPSAFGSRPSQAPMHQWARRGGARRNVCIARGPRDAASHVEDARPPTVRASASSAAWVSSALSSACRGCPWREAPGVEVAGRPSRVADGPRHGAAPPRQLQRSTRYAITRSLRNCSAAGIASPSARAVRALATSSKRVACSMGSWPGLAPLRRRSMK